MDPVERMLTVEICRSANGNGRRDGGVTGQTQPGGDIRLACRYPGENKPANGRHAEERDFKLPKNEADIT